MGCKTFTVRAVRDAEADCWYVADSNVPGLATGADTVEKLLEKLKVMIPELLNLNAHLLDEVTMSEVAAPEEDVIRCPKCGSRQLSADKKGFGLGKALVGGVLTGGVGLLAGFIGSGKVRITCLACGHQWKAGTK